MSQHYSVELTRRQLLLGVLWAGTLIGPGRLLAASPPPEVAPTFRAFIDTLLPADDHSPAASALGIDRLLLDNSRHSRGLRALLEGGCRWLDQQAGGDFTRLDAAQQLRLVDWMATANAGAGPRVFYDRYRHNALLAYYAMPEAWGGMPLPHPPQPRGYREALMSLEARDG